MIHSGYFKNIIGKNIIVDFEIPEDEKTITNSNLGLTSKDFCNETLNNMRFQLNLGTKAVKIEHTTLSVRLCTIRLFKWKPINIRHIIGNAAQYVITDLNKEKAIENGTLTRGNTFTFNPSFNGYMLINISTTVACTLVGTTTRQIVDDSLIFSSDPVTINNKSDGIFAPLKLNSATVRLMTDKTLFDLYTTNKLGVKCTITNDTDDVVLFRGFVTPNMYSQGYNFTFEEVEVECVSPFSALDKTRLREPQDNLVSWYELLKEVFQPSGYDSFILHDSFDIDGDTFWIKHTHIDKKSLIDTDDKYIYLKEVLERFATTFGLSVYEINGEVFFLDVGLLGEEDITYTKYLLDDNTTEVYTPSEPVGIRYEADAHTVSFDDSYSKVKIKSEVQEFDDSLNNIDEDEDLICLHPNIPYIQYRLNNEYYEKDNHVDIYRIYLNKKFTHYSYNSNFNFTNKTYGVDEAPSTMSVNTFRELMALTDNEQWKAKFNTYLRSHLCCFVVKRFSYKYTLYGTQAIPTVYPSKYNFSTEILVSYGMNGWIQGEYSTSYQSEYSALLKNHYKVIHTKPIMESLEAQYISTTSKFDTYLMFNGSVYFMREQYPRYDVDIFKSTLKKDSISSYKSMPVGHTFMYNDNKPFYYDYVFDTISQDNAYKCALDYLYNWHTVAPRTEHFWSNIPNLDGDAQKIESDKEIRYKLYAPQPYIASNNLQTSFALLKDISFEIVKSYPIEYAMDNKISTEDVEYTYGSGKDEDTLDIELPYHTQTEDRERAINSLYHYEDGFNYLSNDIYPYRQNNMTIEDKVGYNNYTHYSQPKLIYNLGVFAISNNIGINEYTRDSSHKLTPITTLLASTEGGKISFSSGGEPFKTFIMDEMEYNILDDYKTIKLIEI